MAKDAAPSIKWERYLANHDMIWKQVPQTWDSGPFMGNGTMGLMMYQPKDSNYLRFDVGNSFVQDHRDDSYGAILHTRPRLPIGYFSLETVGKITGCDLRLSLWNAETKGVVTTDKGIVKVRAYVHATTQAIVVEIDPTDGEKELKLKWNTLEAASPRQLLGIKTKGDYLIQKDYKSNPPARIGIIDGINICEQPLLVGGGTSTAWKERVDGSKRFICINISHSWPENTYTNQAIAAIKQVMKISVKELDRSHQTWWHQFYPKSFVSLPDKKMENFYWIQLYKLASATRVGGALADNQGPWLQETPWPGAWWNLNVQLTYWLPNGSNHPELGEPLLNTLVKNQQTLIKNVPEKYRYNSAGIGRATGQDLISAVSIPWEKSKEVNHYIGATTPEIGLLPWACHNLWLQYRHSMDEEMLHDKLFPLLRRSISYYLHFVKQEEDGLYHLPTTYSPEYGVAEDCNFDLSLLKWGLKTLIYSCERLNLQDEDLPKWKEVYGKLTPYPQDSTGFMLGKGAPFDKSHRHYSHLLMIYPLYLVNKESKEDSLIIRKSLNHWQSLKGALQGYSYTGGSSISSALGDGDAALTYLNGLFTKYLRANTLYRESGPVIETPLSGAQAILDMLIQSWGDKIRIFPALPSVWKDITFTNLRTEGAFLVSAARKEGKTTQIHIKSLAGEPCIVATDMENPVAKGKCTLKKLSEGVYSLSIAKGEEAWLLPSNGRAVRFNPVSGSGSNFFGLPTVKN